MELPKKFKIGATAYRVEQPLHPQHELQRGCINFKQGLVIVPVLSGRTNRPRSEKSRITTFWHEVVHGILHDMGHARLCRDELFVDDFAERIVDVITTARF